MKNRLFIYLQYILPHHFLSRVVGWFAACRLPLIKDNFIGLFARRYDVNMAEAEREDLKDYVSFNDFFTRALKTDARIIDHTPNHLACPVDGAVSQLGEIKEGRIFQAKGHDYSLTDLLGGDHNLAKEFIDGQFATLYLAPKDYHRIHMPFDGQLTHMVYVPGRLFSVNQTTAKNVPNLFARNERVVAIFDTDFGPMAMVMVGAMIVASIETQWAGVICPANKQINQYQYDRNAFTFSKGEEIARFKLGSTVIMCLPKNACEWQTALAPDVTVRLGQMLGKRL